jgi:acyl transferase domain-containing protein
VIEEVGVAQDGRSVTFLAPNGLAQEKLLRSILADAGLAGGDVDYLEAHGTGYSSRRTHRDGSSGQCDGC